MQKNVLHRYIKVKKAIEGQDFINTWKIKDINVLTSIEILMNGKNSLCTYLVLKQGRGLI